MNVSPKAFSRRIYHRPRDLWADIRDILGRSGDMRALMRGETLASDFRERLMLAVTEVNACRYCAYYHARQALAAGLPRSELEALTEGDFGSSPAHERPALLYAQHWAEADGLPDPATRNHIVALFGSETALAIDLALRVIRIGNLLGNTFDYVLYRLSGGRWGH